MLKTYKNDFSYVQRLLETYALHNKDNIPLYIILPEADYDDFIELMGPLLIGFIKVLFEEQICKHLVKESVGGFRVGYVNQEIVKLSFWETNVCENYICLDSEAIFIRDYYISDFMYDDETPYTILFEDNDLKADPIYYKAFWKDREESIRKIQKALDVSDKRLLTCHGFQILSCKVLKNFKEYYMDKMNYEYINLIEISPYEFSWYNIWVQKEKVIPIYPCDQMFKCFHMEHQHLMTWMQGVTIVDLARSYVGIIINSNFSRRNNKLISYEDVDSYLYIPPLNRTKYLLKIIFLSYFRYFGRISKKIIAKIFSS